MAGIDGVNFRGVNYRGVNFKGVFPKDGIYNMENAMRIAHKNPKSYSIMPRGDLIHVVRNSYGNVRIVSFDKEGYVLEVLHRPNVNSGIVFRDLEGYHNILDFENNGGKFYQQDFRGLREVIEFFKNKTPVLKERKPDGTY